MKKLLKLMLLPQDKANHAFWGLYIYEVIRLYSRTLAIIIVVSLAVLKELYDKSTRILFFLNIYKKLGLEVKVGTSDIWDAIATFIVPLILFILEGLIYGTVIYF